MAVSYVGASNAAGENAGTTTTATTVSITPTLPSGAAAKDRILVVQCGSNTSGPVPTGWNVLGTKDTTIGSGAVAAASGARRMTVYYRDYDGIWTMPAFTLTSAAQNSHWIGAVALRRTASTGYIWNPPTISTVGGAFNTATTAYTDTSAASFTTNSGGVLVVGTCLNDNVTATAGAVSQTGATFGTVTERCDGGTATGNDVAGSIHTCSVTTGAAATITHTETLSAASQGETLFIEQTETAWTGPMFESAGTGLVGSATTILIPVPGGVVTNDVILAFIYVATGVAVSAPDGTWTLAETVTGANGYKVLTYWRRATGSDAGTYAFTQPGGATYRKAFAARFSAAITSGDPVDIDNSNYAAASATVPNTSVTTTVANALLVWLPWAEGNQTIATLPSGFTANYSFDIGVDNGVYLDSNPQAAAGASGTISASWSASTNTHAWLGALKPATAAAAVVAKGRIVGNIPQYRSNLY